MNKAQAIYKFFSGFEIPAYAATSVPAQAEFPYLTYELVDGDFASGETTMTVHVWYYTDSEAAPNQKVFEIAQAIGYGGRLLKYDGGAAWIKKGSPWAQSVPDQDNEKVKHRYLNVDVEYMSMN